MKRNIEPCANCPAEIYQGADGVHYHLRTGNKFCLVGSGYLDLASLAGKVAEPRPKPKVNAPIYPAHIAAGH